MCFAHEAWEKGPAAQSQSIYLFIHIFCLVLQLILLVLLFFTAPINL